MRDVYGHGMNVAASAAIHPPSRIAASAFSFDICFLLAFLLKNPTRTLLTRTLLSLP